jgi:glycosyltransferase involved in cell wall biosynthesis
MKKINVLHIIGSLQVGGAEKSLLLLLNNIDRQRFNPVVVTMYSNGVNDFFYEDFRKLNIPLYHLHLRSWRDVATFRQLRKIIRRHRIDIVHSHYGSLEFFGTLYARLAGVRHCVYTKHNLRIKTGLSFKLGRILLNRLLTERILSISKTVTGHLVNAECASPGHIRLVYNPVEAPRSLDPGQIVELKHRWKIPADRFIIGNTSRFDPFKGFDIFYPTLKNLLEMQVPAHAIVMGSETSRTDHQRFIDANKLHDFVTILPFQKDLSIIYSLLNCYLFPSVHTEGFGIALLEAMSYGLPVVGLNCGVISEIIRNRLDGLLPFPEKWEKTFQGDRAVAARALAKAITGLYSSPDLYQKISTNAKTTAAKYSVTNFVNRVEALYLELIR